MLTYMSNIESLFDKLRAQSPEVRPGAVFISEL